MEKENREKNIVMMKRVGKKRKNADDDDLPKRWSDLPNDLLESIKKRLFYIDRCKFSAVCKSWSCIQEQGERNIIPPVQQMPWVLLMNTREETSSKLIDPKYNNTYTVNTKFILKKLDFCSFLSLRIHESKYGWLLISSPLYPVYSKIPTRLILYSPFFDKNNNCIELPNLELGISKATFTWNPLDNDCEVITINTTVFNGTALLINTYRLHHGGQGSWIPRVIKCDHFSLSNVKRWMYSETERIFYYVTSDCRVGTLDLAREEWNVFPPPPTTTTTTLASDIKYFMVKSRGGGGEELFLILDSNFGYCYTRSNYSVQHIFKLDLSSMIWEDLKSIGDRVLFISDNGYNRVLNSSVLKCNGDRKTISDGIYCCSYMSMLMYCSVHDYTLKNSHNGWYPWKQRNCARHYGSLIDNVFFGPVLIDPPSLHH